MSLWIVCLALLGTAVADKFNVNSRIDGTLPRINSYMVAAGLRNITLPDFFLPNAPPVFINVTLEDMSTILRSGDAFMWQTGENSVQFDIPLTLKQMRVNVDLCTFMDTGFVWTVGNASISVGFSLESNEKSDCVTVWQYFNITRLENIMVHTQDPKYDGKPPPDVIMPYIIPHYNKYLNTPEALNAAAKYLNLCDPSKM